MSSQITNVDICFDTNTVITNRIVTTNPYYCKILICLTTKQYIFQKRCFGQIPTFTELKAEINLTRNIVKYIATKNDTLHKHKKVVCGMTTECNIFS